jgi:hypothetical protein
MYKNDTKGRGKTVPVPNRAPRHGDIWRSGGIFHTFLTSALDGGEWSTSHPDCSNTGEEPSVPIGQEAGWAPESIWTQWQREKVPSPPEEGDCLQMRSMATIRQGVALKLTD